jgi:glycosyltransferase involved in cell wall biosynthesis
MNAAGVWQAVMAGIPRRSSRRKVSGFCRARAGGGRCHIRVLAFNWRDINHPEAGGAEVHLHEIMKGLISRGHSVTLLSSSFPGALPEEEIDGIETIRSGDWWNANFVLPLKYTRSLKDRRFDLIVEDINKLPFFTPLYAKCPVVAVVPHLFGATVFQETSAPLALYVWSYEFFIPYAYRKAPFIAISESTREDLVKRGIPRENVFLVHCGLDHGTFCPDSSVKRSEVPTVVFLGRLRKYKGVQILLRAVPKIREKVPEVKVLIVGDGPHRETLEKLAARLGISDVVTFTGFVPSQERVRFLRTSHVAVTPSPKEGWGLTVVEANACGTPVVASRSPGLRDSVRHGETGFLVRHGDVEELAARVVEVLTDGALRDALAEGALEWAGRFTWKACADRCASIIEAVAEGKSPQVGHETVATDGSHSKAGAEPMSPPPGG